MKKILVFSFYLWLCHISYSQISFSKDYRNNDIIEVSIDNIIKIMSFSSSEFKRIILAKGYDLWEVENNCNTFGKGSTANRTIHDITKCSLYFFSIGWYSLEEGKSNISGFVDEIEQYYAGYDKQMQMSVYQIKRNNSVYNFYFSRNQKAESVFCRKSN